MKKNNSLISNTFGFLRLPLEYNPYKKNNDWVITGIPFDMTSSGRSGSKQGPSAIRQVSSHLAWENFRWPWSFDVRKVIKIVDCGDLIFNTGDVHSLTNELQMHAEKLLSSNQRMLSFGGDHYITLPLLRAHAKYFGKIAIIHFDAHTDIYNDGNKYDHGTILFHALNEDLIDFAHSVQIGIRTRVQDFNPFSIFDMNYINELGINNIISKIKKIVCNIPVYLTFDIDCLDPSIAPGTGTPVVGGLSINDSIMLLRGLQPLNIIGMDLVELSPVYDNSQITALSAATLALELLYIQAAKLINS